MGRTPFSMFDVECGAGWGALIQPLLEECKAKGVAVAQVKEKFGTLRFYVHGGDADLHYRIQIAEEKSATTCERCGQPGVLRSGGWLKTLCDEHHTVREAARIEAASEYAKQTQRPKPTVQKEVDNA